MTKTIDGTQGYKNKQNYLTSPGAETLVLNSCTEHEHVCFLEHGWRHQAMKEIYWYFELLSSSVLPSHSCQPVHSPPDRPGSIYLKINTIYEHWISWKGLHPISLSKIGKTKTISFIKLVSIHIQHLVYKWLISVKAPRTLIQYAIYIDESFCNIILQLP